MKWPGMGNKKKQKKTVRFLIILLCVGIAAGVTTGVIAGALGQNNPLKVCINHKDTPYKINAKVELFVDGQRADIPANIGITNVEGQDCQRSIYTLSDDGIVYAEWEEEYPFEVGHFLWIWDFPIRDMEQDKSRVIVNGKESSMFISELLVDGGHYKLDFTSKEHDEAKDSDFLPPDL